MKTATPTKQANANRTGMIIALAIIAILLVIYGFAEFRWQQNIVAMKNAVTSVKQELLIPIGGIENSPPALTHGASVIEKPFCIDINCPQIDSDWFVPLEYARIDEFGTSIEQKLTQGHKGWRAMVTVAEELTSKRPTTPTPPNTHWVPLHIFLTQY